MSEVEQRVKTGFWISQHTQSDLANISSDLNMSVGQAVDWLVMDYLKREKQQSDLAELNQQLKQMRAAMNQTSIQTEAVIQILNTILNLNAWAESDLFDTDRSPANAVKNALTFAAKKRESAIKTARYRAQK